MVCPHVESITGYLKFSFVDIMFSKVTESTKFTKMYFLTYSANCAKVMRTNRIPRINCISISINKAFINLIACVELETFKEVFL